MSCGLIVQILSTLLSRRGTVSHGRYSSPAPYPKPGLDLQLSHLPSFFLDPHLLDVLTEAIRFPQAKAVPGFPIHSGCPLETHVTYKKTLNISHTFPLSFLPRSFVTTWKSHRDLYRVVLQLL